MITAISVSIGFLISYVVYHSSHGATKFAGEGIWRPIYFTLLGTHTVLAAVNLPMVFFTVRRAAREEFVLHRRIARWTWPVWMYVSVTGVIVYLMLYRIFPNAPAPPPAEERPSIPPQPIVPGSPKPEAEATGAEAVFQRARKLHKQSKDAEALALYREAAGMGHLGAKCFAAVVGDRLENTTTASVTISQALAQSPDDKHCLVLQGRELIFANKPEAALPILERALELNPRDGFTHATLGFAQFRTYRYREAAQSFENSTKLDPGIGANIYNAGYSYFLYGDYANAKPRLERAIRQGLDPELEARAKEHLQIIDNGLWVCPMHPEVTGKEGDRCSKCGMELEPASRGIPGER